MGDKGVALVAMRLTDMYKIHPQQDNSHVCAECGQGVGIYPTGQRALSHNPGMTIMCSVCALKEYDGRDLAEPVEVRPAGRWDEIAQEFRDSKPVGKA